MRTTCPSIVLLPFLALLGLVSAQSSPTPCLLPSNSSYVTHAGDPLPPTTGCDTVSGLVNGPVYLVWPGVTNIIIFLGNATNGIWHEPTFLPDDLPVYGFGWILLRPGPYFGTESMIGFATAISPAFAILPPSTSASNNLKPGDVRLLEPTDLPWVYTPDVLYWPAVERIVLQLSSNVSSTAQTVDFLIYGWSFPYPRMTLGQNVPLPSPGETLEYIFNVSLPATLSIPLQLVIVESLSSFDSVLAVSPLFELAQQADFSVSNTPSVYSVAPSGSILTLDGTSFSEGAVLTQLSSNTPLAGWTGATANPPTSTSISAASANPTAANSALGSSSTSSHPYIGSGADLLVFTASIALVLFAI
ncbi:hypothetical protein CALCODRAFT_515285 [Calocera cornea HHB12733]|uniref:Uncharacterized protein n=1 Tax=Calocera cornea HHB12733 TaxID=1353952 RepID=A0A165IF58_9BASI|nr:hypothetical protein CALCODRAFT_515285 [Calocera cornea HHB12733]